MKIEALISNIIRPELEKDGLNVTVEKIKDRVLYLDLYDGEDHRFTYQAVHGFIERMIKEFKVEGIDEVILQ